MRKFRSTEYYELLKKITCNIYFLLGSVFVFRLLLLFLIGNPANNKNWTEWIFTSDTDSYINFANQIYNQSLITFPFRLPGYPLILILTRYLLPVEWLGTIIVQQLLSVITAYMLYLLARRFIKSYALLVPLVFLFEPASLLLSYQLLPETYLVFLEILATLMIVKASKETGMKQARYVIYSSLMLCAGIFFKPILLYAYILYAGFILLYFNNIFWKRLLYVFLFILILQLPLHFYKQFINERFGVYSLTIQEFSEKAARSIDIKYLAENGRIINRDTISAELKRTLIAGGFVYDKRDYVLFAHICDSITSANVKKYPYEFAYHSFAESYNYFEPGLKLFSSFLKYQYPTALLGLSTFSEKLSYLKNNKILTFDLLIILFSVFYSLLLIVSFIIAAIVGNTRKSFSPVVYFTFSWFIYTAVMCGRIASMRYRVTFIWLFVLLFGLMYSHIRLNGLKSVIPSFRRKKTSHFP